MLVQKPRIEQLLINHVRFAYAFKKNDAAKIMPFLDKDVTLLATDGVRHEGLSAVLAYLVGPRMAKLSSHMHVKGSPMCSGPWQSKFVYEHGLLFRQALYTEVIDWKADHVISAISHVLVPDGKTSKAAFQHESAVIKASSSATPPTSQHRMSFDAQSSNQMDDDLEEEDEPEHHSVVDDPLLWRRSQPFGDTVTDRLSHSSSTSSRVSTGSSSGEMPGSHDTTLRIQQVVCHDLMPIRHRKRVNPFITIRKSAHGAIWKSSVARRQHNPTWTNVPIEINAHNGDDIMEISLWDFSLFKSVKVATAALVLADVCTQEEEQFAIPIQLERMDLTDTQPPIQLTMKFSQKHPRWSTARNSHVEDLDLDPAQSSALSDDVNASDLFDAYSCSVYRSIQWSLQDALFGYSYSTGTNMLLRAAFVVVLVWIIDQLNFE